MTLVTDKDSQELQRNTRNIEKRLVSVIALSWNGKHLIDACLNSLINQTYQPLEIIFVDNGSTDGSIDHVRLNFPDVQIVSNASNLGFCGGNNSGIRSAKGSYVALVNNDAVLDPHCIEEWVSTIEKSKDIGVVASKILLMDDQTRLDAAGIGICEDGLSIGRGRMEEAARYDSEAEVFFASDCACLYRKEMLEDIGLYDDDFFAYAEETDLGWRARLRGWRCIYNPRAVAIHRHSSTLGSYSPFKVFLVERNRIWVALKNLPLRYLFTGWLYTLSRYFYQGVGAFTGHGAAGKFSRELSKRRLIWILIKANVSAVMGLPHILRKRRIIQKSRKISNEDVKRLFKSYGMSAREIAFKC